ncbi:MAG: lysophospholipid acyltransferase family protein [Candidatus Binatia bacterium]
MSADAALLRAAEPTRFRVAFNRFLFRAMLFSSGLVAIGLYRVNRPLSWRFAKLQARNLMRLCGVRVRVRGLEQLASGPYLFAPNHQSHFDIAALLGLLPGVTRFATKREMFAEPILGAVIRTMGMIPIDRDDAVASIARLQRVTLDGGSLVIFPEGTRSPDGELLPFRKGAFATAIQLGVPIVPVVCKGTTRIMPKGKYLSILPGQAELVILPPIPTRGLSYADRDRLRDEVRSQIAAELARPLA